MAKRLPAICLDWHRPCSGRAQYGDSERTSHHQNGGGTNGQTDTVSKMHNQPRCKACAKTTEWYHMAKIVQLECFSDQGFEGSDKEPAGGVKGSALCQLPLKASQLRAGLLPSRQEHACPKSDAQALSSSSQTTAAQHGSPARQPSAPSWAKAPGGTNKQQHLSPVGIQRNVQRAGAGCQVHLPTLRRDKKANATHPNGHAALWTCFRYRLATFTRRPATTRPH